ncbi:hypothetical protein RhiirC2_720681 [Rhizophagus irregularis]|uniref:Uncharacterized protein n=1 Tax=Rhizophagus irregularis TaxID=588596 RepID=A0A2N1M9E6_9GLOM|nr:hypothetical protein RhiirC2_720681 [Rhizophagus irregularis]
MDKIVEKNAEEVPTWVTQSKMNSLGQFFKNFEDIYDTHLVDILQCKKIEEYIENLEADVTAKEHIILEKSEQINMLWEKIRGLEAKMEKATCQNADMDLDKKQTKKKCPNKKRKRTQVQHTQNGMISKIKIGPIDDNRKEDLEKYYAEQSCNVTSTTYQHTGVMKKFLICLMQM